nr:MULTISPECIES: hypothetical protein [unclassified Sulfolobus]
MIEKLYPKAYFYLIWGSNEVHWKKVVFDIRKYKEVKIKAINEYKSQIGGLPLDKFTGDYEVFWTKV